MLRIIEGQPGSGKTYYAVSYLSKFCDLDTVYKTYLLDSDILLVTNIDDIKINHISFDVFLSLELYIIDNFKSYMQSNAYKRCIIIIDECQRYLSSEALKDFKNKNDLFFFFEYHRHLGCDIFLICQTVSALPKRLVSLSEYIIRARQQTVSLPYVFLYDVLDSVSGERLQILKLKKDNQVFSLYKSFDFEVIEKPKPLLLKKWVIGISLFLIPLIVGFILLNSGFLFSDVKSKTDKKSNQNNITKVENVSPVVSVSPSNPFPMSPLDDKYICLEASCQYVLSKKLVNNVKGVVEYEGQTFYYSEKEQQKEQQKEKEKANDRKSVDKEIAK